MPVTSTEAMPGAVLLQIPPVTALLKEVVESTHTVGVPVIDPGIVGNGFTVTIFVVAFVPQLLVML